MLLDKLPDIVCDSEFELTFLLVGSVSCGISTVSESTHRQAWGLPWSVLWGMQCHGLASSAAELIEQESAVAHAKVVARGR